MFYRAIASARHQQSRWLRPDAARWVRSDALRFLKPGTAVADIYPALTARREAKRCQHDRAIADALAQERAVFDALRAELDIVVAELARRKVEQKYNADQPRVPAGNSDGGQWTSGSSGSGRPRVYITGSNPDGDAVGGGGLGNGGGLGIDVGNVIGDVFGDIARGIEKIDLFDIKPKKPRAGGVRLAGKPPTRLPPIVVTPDEPDTIGARGIGDNGGPPLGDPPEIPKVRPEGSADRTCIQRQAAIWLGRAIGLGVAIDIYTGVINGVQWLQEYQGAIETYRDPPRTYQELNDAVRYKRRGTEVHHVIERTALERLGFSRREINAPQNLVRIPTLKHYEITSYYSKPNKRFGGLTPREYLADKSIEERFRVGRDALIDVGVLKP